MSSAECICPTCRMEKRIKALEFHIRHSAEAIRQYAKDSEERTGLEVLADLIGSHKCDICGLT